MIEGLLTRILAEQQNQSLPPIGIKILYLHANSGGEQHYRGVRLNVIVPCGYTALLLNSVQADHEDFDNRAFVQDDQKEDQNLA